MKLIRSSQLNYIPASHESQTDPGVWKKVLVKLGDTHAGRLQMINWAKLPIGKSFQPHYHEDMDEVFIMLKGTAKIRCDHETVSITRGDCVVIPMKSVHEMTNVGSVDVEYLVVGVSLGENGKTIND